MRLVQFWLKIAHTVYTSLANVTVDGKFGSATAAAVRRFQSYFGLTSDGVVGRITWNKLYEVYNDIANKLLSSSLAPPASTPVCCAPALPAQRCGSCNFTSTS